MQDQFIHTVLFWFKEPQNPGHRSKFEESIVRFMQDSEYAGEWHVGTPAGTDRKVVDNSYTYCLAVTFPSAEVQDLYQSEPAHHRFIEECSPFWERVQVYDSLPIRIS